MKPKIKLITISKISPLFKEAQNYYLRKIAYFADISLKELSQSDRLTESKKMLKYFSDKSYKVILDEKGVALDSKEFAYKILYPKKNISFFIGGPEGLENFVKEKADFVLSLSKFTLQHDIARIVLLEQIFRGFNILKGTPYHK
ncbi:MAG TPA: 23S rRNA (pseudouridine(1915)-N(3))-methyltransferase RlmH [Aquificae bacterium]|nr:23S rRNA (pseudouridine(1915)-N(3))-methyltransferase RlmH [Aquificota bacterium]